MMPSWTLSDPDLAPPAIPDLSAEPIGRDLRRRDRLEVGADGDYLAATGEELLLQSMEDRLYTSPGTYRHDLTYGAGVAEEVKRPATVANRDALERRVIDNLLQEDAIDDVEEVTLTEEEDDGGTLHHRLRVVADHRGQRVEGSFLRPKEI